MLRIPLIAAVAAVSFLPVSAIADDSRTITMHIINKTPWKLSNLVMERHQTSVKEYSSTIPSGQTGQIEFHYNMHKANHPKMYASYTADNANTESVTFNWEAKYSTFSWSYDCSITKPSDMTGSHNDCSDHDPHYTLNAD